MSETEDCVFCRIVEGTAPATIVREWFDTIVVVPLQPVTDGHLLVIPKTHAVDFTTYPAVTALAFRRAAKIAVAPCNLITSAGLEATQTVFHLHVHVIPRRVGDRLALPWDAPR